MLKNTPPAPRPREATAEELARYVASNEARIASMNRVGFLAGSLTPEERAGLIVLLEAALRDRRALVGLTPATADEGLAYMLPAGTF